MIPSTTFLFVVLFLCGLLSFQVPVSSLSMPSTSTSTVPVRVPQAGAVTPPPLSANDADYTSRVRSKIAGSIAKGERRADERAAQRRSACGACSRPELLCVCDVLPDQKLRTNTRILILQHPNERRKKNLSTVPLLRLVLENVQVIVGYEFEAEQIAAIKGFIAKGQKPLFLYPSPDAVSLDNADDADEWSLSEMATKSTSDEQLLLENMPNKLGNSNLLIIIDGTWTEAKRMVRESPSLLQHCQTVQFTSDATSIYDAVRKEPEAHCLSTLEACAKALELLEPKNGGTDDDSDIAMTTKYLHAVLQSHVDSHLVNAKMMAPRSAGQSTQKLHAKHERRREIELELFEPAKKTKMDDEALIPITPATTIHQTFDDGSILRPLQSLDAQLVDSWWEYRGNKSLPLIKRRIERDGGTVCLGMEDSNGALVACILRYEGGALGMLHVEEPFRRRGYGLALLRQATTILQELGDERVAFIVDGNHASEAVFTAAGWERDDPTVKRGTGKRRAKRKWVHK